MYRLYGSEARLAERYGFQEQFHLAPQPRGLGTRSTIEYTDYFAYELYYKQGVMRAMAGALEAAEKILGATIPTPLVKIPVHRVVLKLSEMFKKPLDFEPVKTDLPGYFGYYRLGQVLSVVGTGLSLVSKVSGIISGYHDKQLAERREELSERGLKRMKQILSDHSEAEYKRLTEALAARGVAPPAESSQTYWDALQERIGKVPSGYQRASELYTIPVLRFNALMAKASDALAAMAVPTVPAPAEGQVAPVTEPGAPGTQAPAPAETKKAAPAWVIPAALIGLKVIAGG